MDFLLTAWLIVFVLMGGAIALVADNLGRKWGKKRYTFHKRIRPKYAAMIMAAGAGMLITFLTIVFIGIVSSDMRTVLLQGRKALAENEGLIRNNNALRSEGSTLRQQNKDLSTSNKELESSNSELQKKLAAANRLLNQTEGKLSLANTDLVEARKQIAPLRTILESTKSELASKKTALDAEKAALSTAKASLAKQLAEYNKLNGNYTKLNTDTNELKSYNLELSFQIDEKRKQIDDLQNQISKQTALISKLETTRQALEKTVGDLETEVRQKEQERDAAINAANLIRNGAAGMIQSSRYQPLILSNGQEIFRIDIPARSSKQDVLTSIDRALATANVQAKDLGAGEDDQMRYAKLFEYIGPNGMPVSEQSQRDTMASSMAGAPNDQVLIIYSRFNTFLKEPVLLGLDKRANPVIYQPGEFLAEVRIDGRKDKSEIVKMLDTLGAKVRTKALVDKMIPASSQENSFGAVTSEQILSLYDEIREHNREVRVRAVAKGQIRAADPLAVSFVVR